MLLTAVRCMPCGELFGWTGDLQSRRSAAFWFADGSQPGYGSTIRVRPCEGCGLKLDGPWTLKIDPSTTTKVGRPIV